MMNGPPAPLRNIVQRFEEIFGLSGHKRRLQMQLLLRKEHHENDLERSRREREEVARKVSQGRDYLADIAYQSLQAEDVAESFGDFGEYGDSTGT